MKKDKLYTVNKWNRSLFAQGVDRENNNIFDGLGSSLIIPTYNPNFRYTEDIGNISPYNVGNSFWKTPNNIYEASNLFTLQQNPFGGVSYPGTTSLGANQQSNVDNWTNMGKPTSTPLNPLTDAAVKTGLATWQKNNPLGGKVSTTPKWQQAAGAAAGLLGGLATKAISGGYSTGGVGEGVASLGNAAGDILMASGVAAPIGLGVKFVSGLAGGVINRGWGVKRNDKNIASIKANTGELRTSGNQLASATTNEAFMDAAANMGSASGFKGGDLVKGGWFSGGKAAREANRYLNAEKQALAYQTHAMAQGAKNVDKIQDDNVMANFAAMGGSLNDTEQYADGGYMGALEYGLALDALEARRRSAEMKNKIPSNPFGALAVNPFNGYAEGGILFGNGGPIIKEENRGKFTAQAKAAGMGTQQFASHVLANKEDYSPTTVKRANFAHVFGGRNYNYGGPLFNDENLFDIGGVLQSHGSDWSNGASHIDEGGTHEENPNQGVQVGVDPEGTPNLVEEGEIIYNDYVYSQRIELDDEAKERFHFSKKQDITYADAAKKLEKEISERPNDPLSKAAFKSQMQDLAEEQERQKAEMQAEEAREQFESLSPEEQVAVMQNAEAQEQQAAEEEAMMQEQAAQEQAMQEQAAMQGQPTEEQMMQEQMMAQQQGMMPQQPMGMEAQMGGYAEGGQLGNEYAMGGNLFVAGGPEDEYPEKEDLTQLYKSKTNYKGSTNRARQFLKKKPLETDATYAKRLEKAGLNDLEIDAMILGEDGSNKSLTYAPRTKTFKQKVEKRVNNDGTSIYSEDDIKAEQIAFHAGNTKRVSEIKYPNVPAKTGKWRSNFTGKEYNTKEEAIADTAEAMKGKGTGWNSVLTGGSYNNEKELNKAEKAYNDAIASGKSINEAIDYSNKIQPTYNSSLKSASIPSASAVSKSQQPQIADSSAQIVNTSGWSQNNIAREIFSFFENSLPKKEYNALTTSQKVRDAITAHIKAGGTAEQFINAYNKRVSSKKGQPTVNDAISAASEASGTLSLSASDLQDVPAGTYSDTGNAFYNTGAYAPTNGTASGGYYQAPEAAQPKMPSMPSIVQVNNGGQPMYINTATMEVVPPEQVAAIQQQGVAVNPTSTQPKVPVVPEPDGSVLGLLKTLGYSTVRDAEKDGWKPSDFGNYSSWSDINEDSKLSDSFKWIDEYNNRLSSPAAKAAASLGWTPLSERAKRKWYEGDNGNDVGWSQSYDVDSLNADQLKQYADRYKNTIGWALENGKLKAPEGDGTIAMKDIVEAMKQSPAWQNTDKWLYDDIANQAEYLGMARGLNPDDDQKFIDRWSPYGSFSKDGDNWKYTLRDNLTDKEKKAFTDLFKRVRSDNKIGVMYNNFSDPDNKTRRYLLDKDGNPSILLDEDLSKYEQVGSPYVWGDPENNINNTALFYQLKSDAKAKSDAAKKDGAKDADKTKAREVAPIIHSEWPRYAGLMGPVVGLGMMAAGIGKPNLNDYDAALDIVNKGGSFASYMPIGNYLKYQPMDIWANQNRMDANSRATDRAILNNASPVGTRNAGLVANSYASQLGSGELYKNALQYNDNLMQNVGTFNRATDMFNAEAFNRTSATNAEIRNRDRQLRAQLGMQAAAEKAAANAGWYNSLYGNVAGLFKGISDLGRENAQRNMISRLAAAGVLGTLTPENAVGAGLVQWKDEADKKKKRNWLSIFG